MRQWMAHRRFGNATGKRDVAEEWIPVRRNDLSQPVDLESTQLL